MFETGLGTTGTNAIVGVGAAFSGTTCNSTPPLAFYGTSVTLSTIDRRHQKVLVLSSNGPGTSDVVTSVSTNGSGDYYSASSLSKRGQASLDTDGSYSAMATDVDGTVGYTAITQLRTDTSGGGLWIYDPTFNRAVKVLGPGGVALPAVNAFIIHNPSSVAGGLLVLTNQDLLTTANLVSPPQVTTPFTVIDMGQLGLLIQSHPTAVSVTLPFVSTIQTALSYYAIFGSAFNPVDNKLYLLTGGGSSASNPIRQVIRYDPADPSHPAEAVMADLSSVPLYPASLPQITLNAAAGTMQILTSTPNAVYSVNITGTGDTATTLSGTTFNDPNFNPTYIATNPLLGETYIASASSKVDVITLPSTLKPRATINLNGPASSATPGQSTSLQIESTFPLYESALATTPITITATAASTGASFTFATPKTVDTLSPTRYVSGTFPTADIYTVVASFPGDGTYAAFTSPKVIVAVGTPLFATSIAVVATSSSPTAGTATVTLSGTTYTPTGTITIKDASASSVLTTYTIPTGGFVVPLSIAFTIPTGTTSITATYSGDSINGQSVSAAATISAPVVKSGTSLTLTGPNGQQVPNTSFNTTVALSSVNGSVPTGQVILSATPSCSSASQVGSTTTTQAFGSGAIISVSLPAGTYTLQASYAGDANFAASSSNSIPVTVATSTTPTATLTPSSLTFNTAAGSTSALQDVVLKNTGGGPLAIAGILASGNGFSQINGCPTSLAAGTQCTIRVSFAPTSGGQVTGAVTITDNATGSPHKVTLTGTASGPIATVTPAAPILGSLIAGTSTNTPTTVFLQNTGTATLTVASFSLDNTVDFDARNVNCSAGRTLAAGASCSVIVSFHPATAGSKSATLQFTTSDTGSPQKALLTGNGLATAACTDQDGDGLCDDWENFGVTVRVDGVDHFIDLPSMGADSKHKDVFVHIDWMATEPSAKGAHTHQPIASAMAIVQKAFSDSPVTNPDGTTGIHLHVDCGSDCIMDPVLGTLWGSMSLAEKLPEMPVLDATTANISNFKWTAFDTNSADFKATGRAFVFHHAIFAHDLDNGPTFSGLSRNGKDTGSGASDFIVTLGSVPGNPRGTAFQQAGTMMHELGHNLGLQHGGQDGQNKKPNYLSVMNYAFQMSGLIVNNDGNGFSNGLYDYSRFALPDIDERALNENTGVAADPKVFPGTSVAFPAINKYGTEWSCPAATGAGSLTYSATIDGPMDWDCVKPLTSPKVRVDTNGDGGLGVFTSFADWPKLTYSGGAVGGSGESTTEAPSAEFQSDQVNTVLPPYRVEISGTGVLQSAPGSTIKLRFQVVNSGALADTYTLTARSPLGWASTTLSPATLALAPGMSALVSVTYTVPSGTPAGASDRIALKVSSQASTRIYDAAEALVYASATPAPLTLSASAVTFPQQPLGSTSVPMPLVLTNTGTAPVSLTGLTPSAQFSQTNDCGGTLAVGDSCVISLFFTPTAVGPQTGSLTIVDTGSSSPETITLTGTGIAAQLTRSQITLGITQLATNSGRTVAMTAKLAAVSGKIPTGTVTFFNDTATLNQATVDASGNATFSVSTLAPGTYDLYAVYSGDTIFYPLTAPDQALILISTSTTLTSSAITATVGTAIVLNATVTSSAGTPSGTVTFLDGTATLGTGTLNGSGVATFSTSTLAIGSHSITAQYAGTGTFPGGVSPATTVVITGLPDFSITATPASLTLTRGTTGTATFTVTPVNGYTGTLKLACGTLPSYASCSISPAQLAFTGTTQSAQTATLTFGTTAQTTALLKPFSRHSPRFSAAALLALPCLGLGLLSFGRRNQAALRLLVTLVAFLGAISFMGCGSRTPAAPPQLTPAGTYTVPISVSDAITNHTLTYSITIN